MPKIAERQQQARTQPAYLPGIADQVRNSQARTET